MGAERLSQAQEGAANVRLDGAQEYANLTGALLRYGTGQLADGRPGVSQRRTPQVRQAALW